VSDDDFAGILMNMLLGAQISVALAPGTSTRLQLISQLEAVLKLLRTPRT